MPSARLIPRDIRETKSESSTQYTYVTKMIVVTKTKKRNRNSFISTDATMKFINQNPNPILDPDAKIEKKSKRYNRIISEVFFFLQQELCLIDCKVLECNWDRCISYQYSL